MLLFVLLSCFASPEKASSACAVSCDHKKTDCETFDVDGCYELCALAVDKVKDTTDCYQLAIEVWECHLDNGYECGDSEELVEPTSYVCCIIEAEFEDSGCGVVLAPDPYCRS